MGRVHPPGAPVIDFVFTVCDKAAAESCPIWPGRPASAHWGIADPAAFEGDEATRVAAFRRALRATDRRIRLFLELPIEHMAEQSLHEELQRIGLVINERDRRFGNG